MEDYVFLNAVGELFRIVEERLSFQAGYIE